MAKALQMLDDDLLSFLEVSALARQGIPSETWEGLGPASSGLGIRFKGPENEERRSNPWVGCFLLWADHFMYIG